MNYVKWLVFAALALLAACGRVNAPDTSAVYVDEGVGLMSLSPSSLILKLAPGLTVDDRAALLARHNLSETDSVPVLRLHFVEVAPDADLAATIAALGADEAVERVEREKLREAEALVSDPSYPDQWALGKIGWDSVYGALSLEGSVKLAVLDTGVDATHPDLAGRVLGGYSAFGGDPTSDPSGHGTAVAGIAAAATNNETGVAGVAFDGVSVLSVQVLDENGLGQDGDIIAGVVWAADAGAKVILMAFSNPGYSPSLQEAINYAWSKGAVLVAATGNDGSSTATFPAGSAKVVGVSATNQDDALWEGSSYGASTFIAAPGADILTLAPGEGVVTVSGTSASAAFVAGAAALMKAQDPALSNGVIVGRLARSADAAGTQAETGNGRLNLARALEDASTDAVTPGGASPAEAGPFVGPYEAAASIQITQIGFNIVDQPGSFVVGVSNNSSNPLRVQTRDSGGDEENVTGSGNSVTVQVTSSSPTGRFDTSHTGSYSATSLSLVVPSGSRNTQPFYYRDTTAGSVTLTATVTAKTNGLSNLPLDSSASIVKPVNKAASTTTLASSLNPSVFGNGVTFIATVAHGTSGFGTPTGIVQFMDGAAALGSSPVSGGVATFSTPALASGSHSITAVYSGDANFNGGISPVLSQSVAKANQAPLNVLAPAAGVFGQVYPLGTSGGSGTGAVSFSSGSSTACSVSGPVLTMTGGSGTCSVTATKAGDANYNPATSGAATITVQKADQTIMFTALPDKTFGNPEFTVSATASSGLPVMFSAVGNCTLIGATTVAITGAGSCTVTAVQAGDGNYNAADPVARSFAIAKAQATITLSGLSYTYDGSPKAASATTSPTGLEAVTLTYDGSPTAPTDAGSYAVVASLTNDNYEAPNATSTLVIARAPSSTVVTCEAGPFTYTGAAQTPCTAAVTGVGGLSEIVAVTYSDNTGAGAATASATYAGGTNHEPSSDSETFTIAKAVTATVITCAGGPFAYTGSAIESCTVTVTGANLNLTPTPDYTDNIDAGTATASYVYAESANHFGSEDSETFAIDRADASITVTGGTFTYDGQAHGASGSAKGVQNESLDGLSLGDSFTDVPGGTAAWTFTDVTGNYNDASGAVQIVITKADAVIDIQGVLVTYDGQPHGATGTATGADGADLSSLLDLGSSFTAVPGGTTDWSFAGDANHNPSSGTVSIIINKADADITVTGGSFTYDGVAKGATGSATGADGVDLSASLDLGATYTAVPGGAATWSFSGDTNHNAASGSVQITINKATPVINVQGGVFTYDGQLHGATGTATGADGSNLSSLLDLGGGFANVPGGTANWTFAGDANHNSASGTADIVITPAAVSFTISNTSFLYDGAAKSVAITSVPAGVPHTVVYTSNNAVVASPTLVGSYTVTVTSSDPNYAGSALGTLIISPWRLQGFYQPVDMNGVWNTVKGGSTVPLKFEVFSGTTELTSTSVIGFSVARVSCTASGTEDTIEMTTTGGTSLRYDGTSGQFIQNWQTPKRAGECYRVTMRTSDASSLVALFKLR